MLVEHRWVTHCGWTKILTVEHMEIFNTKHKYLITLQVEVGSFTVLGIGPAPVDQVGKQCLDILMILLNIRLRWSLAIWSFTEPVWPRLQTIEPNRVLLATSSDVNEKPKELHQPSPNILIIELPPLMILVLKCHWVLLVIVSAVANIYTLEYTSNSFSLHLRATDKEICPTEYLQ